MSTDRANYSTAHPAFGISGNLTQISETTLISTTTEFILYLISVVLNP